MSFNKGSTCLTQLSLPQLFSVQSLWLLLMTPCSSTIIIKTTTLDCLQCTFCTLVAAAVLSVAAPCSCSSLWFWIQQLQWKIVTKLTEICDHVSQLMADSSVRLTLTLYMRLLTCDVGEARIAVSSISARHTILLRMIGDWIDSDKIVPSAARKEVMV